MSIIIYSLFKFYFKYRYKNPAIFGVENYDSSVPAIFMCNHEKFYGPIIATTRFPIPKRTWANSMTVEKEAARKYVTESFFMGEKGKGEKISRFYGYLLGTLVSLVISGSNPIVAYWDNQRARKSIRSGIEVIVQGENQLMFARRREFTNNQITFLPGYLFLCKIAAKKHGINPKIYPIAVNKEKATIAIGKPTTLDINLDYEEESDRINKYLSDLVMLGYEDPKKMSALK
ncbi:MAG: hypothetical protein KAH14_03130 [Clostridiales bacterium]|nr:hypothetical protein [Clostridiales bacterium]